MNLDLPLKNIIRIKDTTAENNAAIFFLHGYGSNMQDLDGLSHQFDGSWTSISLQASIPVQFNGWAWADLDYNNLGILPKPEQMRNHRKAVIESIDICISKLNIDATRIHLLGFSQGAALAMYCGLIFPKKFCSVVSVCGFLPMDQIKEKIETNLVRHLNVLMVNGRQDSIVPLSLAKSTRDGIKSLGMKPDYKEYNMEHSISYDCLRDILTWLNAKNE